MTSTAYPDIAARLGATRFRPIHVTQQPRVVEALTAIPGYVRARGSVLILADYAPEIAAPPADPVAAMVAVILDAVDHGREPPRNLADEVPDQEAFRRHNEAAAEATVRAREAMAHRLDQLIEVHMSTVRKAITDGLVDVISQAREVARHGAPSTDAAAAIEAGDVDAFKQVTTLEAGYAHLQSLHQVALLADPSIVGLTGDPATFKFYVRNPLEVWGPDGFEQLLAARGDAAALTSLDLPTDWTAGPAVWWWTRNPVAKPWAGTHEEVQRNLAEVHRELAEAARTEAAAQPVEALR
jgi:hypothetical protein